MDHSVNTCLPCSLPPRLCWHECALRTPPRSSRPWDCRFFPACLPHPALHPLPFSLTGREPLRNISSTAPLILPSPPLPPPFPLLPHLSCLQVTKKQLHAIFTSALTAGFNLLSGTEPVVAVSFDRNTRGRFARLDLQSPEMADAAVQLSGQVTLFGRAMSVGRPRDYVNLQQLRKDLQVGVLARGSEWG